jgi:Na+/melibiose symporter-like transporter
MMTERPTDKSSGQIGRWSAFAMGPAQIVVGVLAMIIDALFFGGVELVSFGTIFLAAGIVLTINGMLVRRRARRRHTDSQEQR